MTQRSLRQGGPGCGGQGLGHGQPRVLEDFLEANPLVGSEAQAGPDQVLTLVGQAGPELDLGIADGLVLLEGDVSAHHVVKEDPKAPNSGGIAMVAAVTNPFRWGIHSRS